MFKIRNDEQQIQECQQEEIVTHIVIGSPVSNLKPLINKQQPKTNNYFAVAAIVMFILFILYLISASLEQKAADEDINQLKEQQIELCKAEKNKLEGELALSKRQIQKMNKQIQVLNQLEISRKKQQQEYHQKNQKIDSNSTDQIQLSNSKSLPLKMPFINDKKQKVQAVLYPDQNIRKQRIDFQNQRVSFLNSKTEYPNINLAKHNLILDEAASKLAEVDFENDWKRAEQKYKLSKITTELPMCVISPGYNNNAKFRIEYSLNSIFTQNYTNYKAVIINDASTDGSGDVYRKYFQFYGIDKSRYTYIQNTKRVTAVENFYKATRDHCRNDSIVVTIDADDQFIGRNILKIFNWAYTTKKSGVVYSNFYWYQQPSVVRYGFTSEYSQNQKKDNSFRRTPMKFSHLRSYRTELFLKIKAEDLQDQQGNFYTITYDIAMFVPLMELSCGRVNKIEGEYQYLYNVGTGLNDERGRQVEVDQKIRAKKRYDCDKQFNDRMAALPQY